MAKNSITDYSKTAASNTDIQSVDIAEGCLPSGINNAIREIMADLADMNDGTVTLTSPSFAAATITGNLTVDTNTLYVDSTNNRVGIGTSSPTSDLTFGAATPTISTDTSDGSDTSRLSIGGGGNATSTGRGSLVQYHGNEHASAAGSMKHFMGNASGSYISWHLGSGTEAMRMDSSGRVGIGTSSPSTDLHVYGSAPELRVQSTATNNGFIRFINTSGSMSVGMSGSAANQFLLYDRTNSHTAYLYAGGASGSHTWRTNNTERMRIDSSGRVGIGTTSPASLAHIYTSSTSGTNLLSLENGSNKYDFRLNGNNLHIRDGSDDRITLDSSGRVGIGTSSPSSALEVAGQVVSTNSFKLTANVSTPSGNSMFRPASNTLAFATNSSERMRIDSSGNVLVGQTSANSNAVGIGALSYGSLYSTRDGGSSLLLNRKTSDGDIAVFQKDGTTVGRVGAFSNSTSYCGASSGIYFNGANINPTTGDPTVRTDNANDIGQASQRFKDLYLGGGVYLGGTGSANKLDDYEEGTWTPTAGSNVAAISGANGHYTKVGNLVTITLEVNADPTSTSSNMAFGGLPFTVVNHLSSTNVGATGIAYEDNSFFVFWANETTNTFLIELDRPLQGSASSTSTNYRGTLTYFTS